MGSTYSLAWCWLFLELVWRLIGVLLIELCVFLSRAIGLAVSDLADKLTIDRVGFVDGRLWITYVLGCSISVI